jgi:hypothetical protein
MADERPDGPDQPSGPPPRRRWRLALEIATFAAAVTAVLAYVFPRATGGDSGGSDRAAPSSAAPTGGPPTGGQPSSAVTPTLTLPAGPTGSGPYLSELTPSEGRFFLARTAESDRRRWLVMPCPPAAANFESREVVYDLRGGRYGHLLTGVRVSGSPNPPAETTVLVLADHRHAAQFNLLGDATTDRLINLDSPHQLALRITCQSSRTTVTFTAPQLLP